MDYVIAKSCKGKEYLYNGNTTILTGKTRKKAQEMADFLNSHNDTAQGIFKLKDNEIWHVHEDIHAVYKISKTRGKIAVKYNI